MKTGSPIDFNVLEAEAARALAEDRVEYAIAIYAWMATGDSSLDGGYLGERLGRCYERLGQAHVARYWYSRAVEENPGVRSESRAALDRLDYLNGSDFIAKAHPESSKRSNTYGP